MVQYVANGLEVHIFFLSGCYDDNDTTMFCTGPVVAMMMLVQWDDAAPAARATTDRFNM